MRRWITLWTSGALLLAAAAGAGSMLRGQPPSPQTEASADRAEQAGPVLPVATETDADPAIYPPLPRAAGTWSELMIDVIYPASNELFYIARDPPEDSLDWDRLRMSALMLAEAGNVLMMKGRGFDNGKWQADARLMVDAGIAAYEAAKRQDQQAIEDLNDKIYVSCTTCHSDYRNAYGRPPQAGPQP